MRYWKPEDIFEAECPKCGKKVEFFKDEVKRRCRCGHEIVNARIDLGCAQWCPYAEQCVGTIPDDVKARQKAEEKALLRERIALEMKKYYGTDFRPMSHALKVARYAEQILKMEGGNPLIVLGASYLHGMAVHKRGKRSEGTPVHVQDGEGLAAAKAILEKLSVEKEIADEICDILGHLDRPREQDGLNFQIVYEAEWLATAEEKGISTDREKDAEFIDRVFRTVTGKQMARNLLR